MINVWIKNPFDEENNGASYRNNFVNQDDSSEPLFIPAMIAEVAQAGADPEVRVLKTNLHVAHRSQSYLTNLKYTTKLFAQMFAF